MSYEGPLAPASELDHITERVKTRINVRNLETIRQISKDSGESIALIPLTQRRATIANILLEIAEQDGWIDEDLVRSICTERTGKKYPNAGAALADLDVEKAEEVWQLLQDIYADRVLLEYNPVSNNYHTYQKEPQNG